MKNNKRFAIVDGLLIAMMLLPLLAAMTIKVLMTPASEGMAIEGALIYFTLNTPVMELPISEAQVNSWLVMITILGFCLYMTHGITERGCLRTMTNASPRYEIPE